MSLASLTCCVGGTDLGPGRRWGGTLGPQSPCTGRWDSHGSRVLGSFCPSCKGDRKVRVFSGDQDTGVKQDLSVTTPGFLPWGGEHIS